MGRRLCNPIAARCSRKEQLEQIDKFYRYFDKDGDAIPYRTLPGTHPKGAYFTRGSGHTQYGGYTEDSTEYQIVLDRLKRKFDTAKKLVPKAVLDVAARRLRQRLPAPDLAGGAAPAQRRPHHRADALIERPRHQLPFIIAADQRIIGLVGDIAFQAQPLGDRQRLHQVPAGKIGDADITDLALFDQRIEVESTSSCGVWAS